MKSKGKGPPSTDLLVCFPTRAHLTLMPPKSINSPIRPSTDSSSSSGSSSAHRRHIHRRGRSFGVGQSSSISTTSSPSLWSKNKTSNDVLSEPTSPKVTCAGQIKVVRPKPNCKNWKSVMEQIERIHNSKSSKQKNKKKKPNWAESLGFKKDVMQFLTCMRNIRFDFRCFGAFPNTAISSDDDDDDDDDEDEDDDHHQGKPQHSHPFQEFLNRGGVKEQEEEEEEKESSNTYFSKWCMVLQDEKTKEKTFESYRKSISHDEIIAPPPNALLLMRCRSAPAKSWLEEEEEEKKKIVVIKEEEKTEEKQSIVYDENMILRYGAVENEMYKYSSDIAKETWVFGGSNDSLSRSRSCRR